MDKLEIKDLYVEVDGKEILKGVSLNFETGKVHAIMGPNGSGKSTLAYALMGHPKYKITGGKILLNGEDISSLSVDKRAQKGIFLSFQYPKEIAGVKVNNFLREAVNLKRKLAGEKEYSVVEFFKLLKEKMELLGMDASFRRRSLNEGFSGGEKKRMEMLQMLLLEPKFAILDETDSGLDVDGIRAVASAIKAVREKKEIGIVLITHYESFINELMPSEVSVLCAGKVIREGSIELAKEIQEKGFEKLLS